MWKRRPWTEVMAVPEWPQDGLEGSLFSLDQADVAYQPRRVAGSRATFAECAFVSWAEAAAVCD